MKREEKAAIIDKVSAELENYSHFYVTDTSGLNAEETSNLRRQCFKSGIKLIVVKNTLFKKALEARGDQYQELYDSLKGTSAIMFTETGNLPAKLIKDIRKKSDKPILKAAFVEESIYIGDDQIEVLSTIKSKEELIADIIALLQSPVKNVMSQLQSGANILHGVLETLSKKE